MHAANQQPIDLNQGLNQRVSRLRDIDAELQIITTRLENVAERIFGPIPDDVTPSEMAEPPGAIYALDTSLDGIEARLATIRLVTSRLEDL